MPAFKINNDVGSTFLELCAPSGEKFRKASIPLTVWSGQTLLSTAALSVITCVYAKPPGSIEESSLYLEDDGTLLTDVTAGDVRVQAHCSPTPPSSTCPHGDDF